MSSGQHGFPNDPVKAVQYFRESAELGNADAQFNLGVHSSVGLGLPKSDTEAVKWYLMAAQQGHAGAMSNLGVCYLQGRGVPAIDPERAVTWLERAAKLGSREAALNLSMIQQQLMNSTASGKKSTAANPGSASANPDLDDPT